MAYKIRTGGEKEVRRKEADEKECFHLDEKDPESGAASR